MPTTGTNSLERALFVRGLYIARGEEGLTADEVRQLLACGRHQARKAITQERAMLAGEGYAVSYANVTNGYTTACNGDVADRVRSYVTRKQAIITQEHNASLVIIAAGRRAEASPTERILGRFEESQLKQREAQEMQLEIIRDLVHIETTDE